MEGKDEDLDCTDKLYAPPPGHVLEPEDGQNVAVPSLRVPLVSEDVAREALLTFVGGKWTYSSKPARNLVFKDLRPLPVFRYRLETYTESRSSALQCEPYTDQFVDGPQYGTSPLPWDILVEAPLRYSDLTQKVRVPHSSFVEECHQCLGQGKVRCHHCHGIGRARCGFCCGSGRSRKKQCTYCHGSGRKRCSACHAKGCKICSLCLGHRNMMHYTQLTVTWKNHVFEFIPDHTPEFPVKKFEKVSGEVFFLDESILIHPIVSFPDPEICNVSRRISEEHLSKLSSNSRILQQRQTMELIPLTHAFYSYGGKDYDYFVYGVENKVYTPKYPSNCCIL